MEKMTIKIIFKKFKKFFLVIFREIFFLIFLAICVPQPIWGMPAKIWGV
jgi:hypothetical protein